MDSSARSIRDLVHAHVGRPAVVMGGGPSLPDQLKQCPPREDAVYISANDHGARLAGCDYIVCLDDIESTVRPFGVPIVSKKKWADYRLHATPSAGSSGVTAAWVARLLGCAPIYIVGMDCFTGATYWHDAKAESAGLTVDVAVHLARWRNMMIRYPADYRAFGRLAIAIREWERWGKQVRVRAATDAGRLAEEVECDAIAKKAATSAS